MQFLQRRSGTLKPNCAPKLFAFILSYLGHSQSLFIRLTQLPPGNRIEVRALPQLIQDNFENVFSALKRKDTLTDGDSYFLIGHQGTSTMELNRGHQFNAETAGKGN